MAFRCVIVTPEQQALDDSVEQVIIPAWDGQIGILTGHSALLVKLGLGVLRVDFAGGKSKSFMIDGGVAQMKGDHLTIITDDAIAAEDVDFRPGDYLIPKRRYSAFFGTDFEILLKGLKAETLVLCGGLTDVCIHYTFVDAHQHNYYCRVVEDCVGGSSLAAHESALAAMEYLQTGARCTSAAVLSAFGAFAPSLVA